MRVVSSSRLLHIIFSLCILDFFIFYHRVKDLMLQLCVVLVVQYSKYGRESACALERRGKGSGFGGCTVNTVYLCRLFVSFNDTCALCQQMDHGCVDCKVFGVNKDYD